MKLISSKFEIFLFTAKIILHIYKLKISEGHDVIVFVVYFWRWLEIFILTFSKKVYLFLQCINLLNFKFDHEQFCIHNKIW